LTTEDTEGTEKMKNEFEKRYAEGAKGQRSQRRVFNTKIAKGSKGERVGVGGVGGEDEKTRLRPKRRVGAPGYGERARGAVSTVC